MTTAVVLTLAGGSPLADCQNKEGRRVGLSYLNGKSWAEVTREERVFCQRLFSLLEQHGSMTWAHLDQPPGGEGRQEYLVVLTADEEFVDYKGFYPPGAQPPHGKYMELLTNAKTHLVDTFGIGNDVVETAGLGQVSSYVVN